MAPCFCSLFILFFIIENTCTLSDTKTVNSCSLVSFITKIEHKLVNMDSLPVEEMERILMNDKMLFNWIIHGSQRITF